MLLDDIALTLIIVLLFAALAFYIRVRMDGGRYLVFWGSAYLVSALNFAQQTLVKAMGGGAAALGRGLPIDGVAHLLSILVAALILIGVVEFRGRRLSFREAGLPVAAILLICAALTILDMRIAVIASAASICAIFGLAALLLWQVNRHFCRLAAVALLLRCLGVGYILYLQAGGPAAIQLSGTFFSILALFSGFALIVVALDEENQKQMQRHRDAEDARSLLQDIIDAVPAGIMFKDADLRYAYVNKVAAESYGGQDRLIGRTASEVFAPDILADHLEHEAQVLETGGASPFRQVYDADTDRTLWITRRVLRHPDGALRGIITVGIDISKQSRSLALLERAQRLARAGWFEYRDADRTFSLAASMAGLLGLPDQPRHSRSELLRNMEPESVAQLMAIERRAIAGRVPYYFDAWYTDPAGRRFWLHTEAMPKYDAEGNFVGSDGFLQDLTGLKQREDALRQKELELVRAQRVESIGRLAGGIAHDFNNILAAISGFAELIRQDATPGSTVATFVDRIARSAERGRQVVRQILAYARANTVERSVIDLAAVVREVADLARATIPTSTKLDLDAPSRPIYVQANEGQIHQIVLNLCMNSNDAFTGQPGHVRVSVRTVAQEAGNRRSFCSAGPTASGGGVIGLGEILADRSYVLIEVQDDGPGMAWDVLSRWDEPFFTTKEAGRGTGLGLPIVKGIVVAYGGAMCIESAPGTGTSVSVYLPLDPVQLPMIGADDNGLAAMMTKSGRVVVVDDEVDVRDVTAIALRRAGHDVVAFDDPVKALEHIRNRPDDIDVLVTDHVMPGMKGMDLIAETRRVAPAVRAILCTGFSDQATERSAGEAGASMFFEKPVSGRAIVDAVQQLLAKGH